MELLLHEFLTPTTDGRKWFSTWLLYYREDSSRNPLDGKLGGPQKNPMPLHGIKPKFSGRPVRSLVTMPTELKIAKTHVRVQVWF